MLRKIVHYFGKASSLGGAAPLHSKAVTGHAPLVEHA